MNGDYDHILVALWRDLQNPDVLWQVGALALCLLAAWQLSRSVRMPEDAGAGMWRLGVGGIKRVLLPALALVFVLSARPVLAYGITSICCTSPCPCWLPW
jgi:hypothetical protein